jgi:hypothetical protein
MTTVGRKPRTPEQMWKPIADTELAVRGVKGGTGFGRSEGLRISNKIYAMLVNGELVVRIPKARVDQLVDAGIGRRFEPSPGRVMKEWLSLPSTASRRWRGLVVEARTFVQS